METERYEALIDAILAIILTIIVLEIPMASDGSWAALFEVRLEFIIYALSFIVVFNFWNYTNNMYSLVNKINHKAIWTMGLALFMMSLLPYLTIFVAENFNSFIPHAFYGINYVIVDILCILHTNELKNSDPGNIALQIAFNNYNAYYSTIIIVAIGFIVGYFLWPPAIGFSCLLSIPAIWIIHNRS